MSKTSLERSKEWRQVAVFKKDSQVVPTRWLPLNVSKISNAESSSADSDFQTVVSLLLANPTVTRAPKLRRRLPAAACQGSSPWSSSFPPTPSSGVWALAETGTWSLSWPARPHRPPSARRRRRHRHLPRLPRPRSWSHLPRTAASVAHRTDASDAWETAPCPGCSSWSAGWSSHCQCSKVHAEKCCGH